MSEAMVVDSWVAYDEAMRLSAEFCQKKGVQVDGIPQVKYQFADFKKSTLITMEVSAASPPELKPDAPELAIAPPPKRKVRIRVKR